MSTAPASESIEDDWDDDTTELSSMLSPTPAQTQDPDRETPQATARHEPKAPLSPAQRYRRQLFVRRLIGVLIIAGLVWLGIWFALWSPASEQIRPTVDKAASIINGTTHVNWASKVAAIGTIAALHIGMIEFLFNNRR